MGQALLQTQNTNVCTQNDTGNAGAVAELLRGERVVAYRPCFARAFGGASCALLLSQFCYWAGTPTVRGRGGDGWFWKPQREITEETGLSRTETQTARRKLRELGVLQEARRGIPATLHFRVDKEAVFRHLGETLPPPAPADPAAAPRPLSRNRPTCLPAPRKLVCGNPAIKFAGFLQSTTETSSETTQQTTQTRGPDVSPSAFGRERPSPPAPFPRKEGGVGAEIRAVDPKALPGPSLAAAQIGINQAGAARFKAALEAARKKHPPGRDGPPP